MPRAVSRKNFLRLGGVVGLAGAVLLGVTGCSGDRKVVSFLDATTEPTALERAVGYIIERFEEKNPNIGVRREAIPTEDVRAVIQTSLRSGEPPDVFCYDTGPGFGGVLADEGLLRSLGEPINRMVGISTTGPSGGPPTTAPSTGSPIGSRS